MPYDKKRKRTYSDIEQSEALTMLVSEGYPENASALTATSKALAIPDRTLLDWYHKKSGIGVSESGVAVSANAHADTKDRFLEAINTEIDKILLQLDSKRSTASYRDLGIVLGILFDKRDRVMGMPTQTIEHRITFDETEKAQRLAAILSAAQPRIPSSIDETIIESDVPTPSDTGDSTG